MVKASFKKRKTKECVMLVSDTHSTPPRWRILPPDIIHIIVQILKHDTATLRSCSLAAREFSQAALSCIGRHITVNRVPCIKLCVQLLTANSAFHHVRSLDLGVTSKGSNSEEYLNEQFAILEIFAQRQTLTRLWLSRMPFSSIEPSQREKVRDIIAALSCTVNDLGLYECRFLSYTDMISFIRAFHYCDSLYIRDCATADENPIGDTFSGLSRHNLSLITLELTSASPNRMTVDVSSLIEDAALDVSQLSALTCNIGKIGSTKKSRSVATVTSASPIRHFQLTSTEPGVFQAFLNRMVNKWSLETLAIGPLTCRTDTAFWRDAFRDFPNVPNLKEVTIIYYYPNADVFDLRCWRYFNDHFCRSDLFPRRLQVEIQATIRSTRLDDQQSMDLREALQQLRVCRDVTFWGT